MKRIMTLIRPIGVLLSFGKVRGGFGVMSFLFLALLSVFACSSRHDAMVERLEALQKFNQADSVFTTDSAALVLADYFDAHGDANERMLAHYLLGRAYYDMGETPLALHHYHEAIESADTTDKDCDFRQLGRIHGQAASLLLNQGDPKDASAEFDKAIRILKICDDTLGWIACLENKGSAYEYLNRLDSAVIIRKYASQQYSKYGCHSRAAIAMAPVIDILVEQKRMKEARQVIQEYESVGALFDENHEIQKGREIYYYSKGLYYLGIAELDSAESCFRKLLSRAQKTSHLSGAYRGLEKLYREKGVKDSALHYSMLAYAYNDSCHREKNTENYQRAQAQYDYSRHQQAAAKASERARRLTWATACLCGVLLLLLWAGV
ncbi:MAG: tetratricopeptide repeat protein, partial [Alloprevotella sp.]|nr:tetratricopeptide repeat protein [Alloprevotella sp.]